jgi:hypothetical protein
MPFLFSSFLLFLSFFFWGVAFAKKLRSSTAYLCEKNQRGRNFDLDIKPPTNRNKEKQQERDTERGLGLGLGFDCLPVLRM